jgi:RHS repeat-associated protein
MATVRYTTVNGEVIAEKRNGVRRLYSPDPLGSTVALLDNTQTQVDTFTYWPYGEVRTSTGTTPPPFQFVGTEGYYTDSTGRIYVRARYLHTQKGRWLTQDPVAFSVGVNMYLYCNNNPATKTDPVGLVPLPPLPPGRSRGYGQCVIQCTSALLNCLGFSGQTLVCGAATACCLAAPETVLCCTIVGSVCAGVEAAQLLSTITFCLTRCLVDRSPVHCHGLPPPQYVCTKSGSPSQIQYLLLPGPV